MLVLNALRFGVKGQADDVIEQEQGEQHAPLSLHQAEQQHRVGDRDFSDIEQIAVFQHVLGIAAHIFFARKRKGDDEIDIGQEGRQHG
ncbi:hypothetical protein D3C76_1636420 [compost metagenome]